MSASHAIGKVKEGPGAAKEGSPYAHNECYRFCGAEVRKMQSRTTGLYRAWFSVARSWHMWVWMKRALSRKLGTWTSTVRPPREPTAVMSARVSGVLTLNILILECSPCRPDISAWTFVMRGTWKDFQDATAVSYKGLLGPSLKRPKVAPAGP